MSHTCSATIESRELSAKLAGCIRERNAAVERLAKARINDHLNLGYVPAKALYVAHRLLGIALHYGTESEEWTNSLPEVRLMLANFPKVALTEAQL